MGLWLFKERIINLIKWKKRSFTFSVVRLLLLLLRNGGTSKIHNFMELPNKFESPTPLNDDSKIKSSFIWSNKMISDPVTENWCTFSLLHKRVA